MRDQKKDQKSKVIFSVLVIFFLFSSVIGFAFSFSTNHNIDQVRLNGNSFIRTPTGYALDIDDQIYEFSNLPSGLPDTSQITSSLSSSAMSTFTSDPNSVMASQISALEFDISNYVATQGNFVQIAFSEENQFDKPVISCIDATQSMPVILFNFTNSTSGISSNNNCHVVNFKSAHELSSVRDSMLYNFLGVANEN